MEKTQEYLDTALFTKPEMLCEGASISYCLTDAIDLGMIMTKHKEGYCLQFHSIIKEKSLEGFKLSKKIFDYIIEQYKDLVDLFITYIDKDDIEGQRYIEYWGFKEFMKQDNNIIYRIEV